MTWDEICADPNLRDLPFKIETNGRGQILMSPARAWHGEFQYEIGTWLKRLLPHGRVVMECAIETTAGVRVPDVVWTSPERRQRIIYKVAPEVCVEVVSPYNDEAEMVEKRALYFEAGAVECWQCAEDGTMRFFSPAGALPAGSTFCPGFPARVET